MAACRFATWSPFRARLALLALVLTMGYGLLLPDPPLGDDNRQAAVAAIDRGDVALYRALVQRMSAGEGYYEAAGDEQHQRGYATKPFLTWRLPTAAWIISRLGEVWAANVLRLLALLALLAWVQALMDLGLGKPGVISGALLVCSGMYLALPIPTIYLHEIWAATLMALSLPLQQRGWPLSVVSGLAALAFRELALPFVLVMAACAFWDGRRAEAAAWVLGILAFAIGLTLHGAAISEHLNPEARQGGGWLDLGGWARVLAFNHWNLLIPTASAWLTALWVPLALLGAGARQEPLGNRLLLLVAGYNLAFFFIGRPNNDYWGIIPAPLVAVSLTFAPSALLTLWTSARGKPG